MSRYIDADKAIEIWKDQDYIKLSSQETNARIMLDAVPTADVVEVVRCKDCEFWDKDETVLNGGICEEWSDFEDSIISYTKPDDYCSCGERKEK